MKFEIHFELADGSEDFVVIEGDTVEEIREKADAEVAKRNGENPWSKEL
jgi:hypothetical protein